MFAKVRDTWAERARMARGYVRKTELGLRLYEGKKPLGHTHTHTHIYRII
jgi:hypothetical protein